MCIENAKMSNGEKNLKANISQIKILNYMCYFTYRYIYHENQRTSHIINNFKHKRNGIIFSEK